MAIVVNKPLPEFEANATGGIKVTNTTHVGKTHGFVLLPQGQHPRLHHRSHAVPGQVQGFREGWRRQCSAYHGTT